MGRKCFQIWYLREKPKDKNYQDAGRLSDDDYAWMSKYGDSRETAFAKIKQLIIQIIDATSKNDLKTVENIDFGDAYKWKIAFLYSDYKILNIFNKIKLVEIAKELNLEYDKSFSFAKLQSMILHTKDEKQDFFEFGKKVWDLTKSKINKKYWLYSPGEQAYKWEEFFVSGVMALGWDELGDLGSYESRNDISKALYNSYGGKENKPNDTTANDEFANVMNVGDVVIVKKGLHQLLGYGIVESEYYLDESRDDYKHCRKVNWIKKGSWPSNHTLVLKTLTEVTNFDSSVDKKLKYYEYLLNIMDNKTTRSNNFLDILKYKKQIILQGPPGTSKTREAKEISRNMISLTDEFLKRRIKVGMEIPTAKGQVTYKVISISDNNLVLQREKGTTNIVTLSSINTAYTGKKWKNEITNNDDRMAVAIAKYFYDDFFTDNEQLKIIQFHPSYTYEDFVRGIVAESKGEKIEYKNVNKTVALFAAQALKNFENSKKVPELISKELWVQEKYVMFKEYLESVLEKSGEVLIKHETKPKITAIEDDAIRVNRYSNENDSVLIKDNDIIYGYIGLHFSETIVKVKDNSELSKSARSGMYYLYQNLIEKFREYLEKENLSYHPTENAKLEELKNYILIIDEINRANLSSVLGELIYALEYRGEEVESMYEVDGSQKLILPPNLYIIGTMNTADRSVGHIDYAIRRRFAFVEVLPKDLSIEMEADYFYTSLFTAVKSLFTSDDYKTKSDFISQEFEPKDVALGHSYFIDKSEQGGDEKIRWEYEIKPILIEYVRDGVLKQTALQKISEIEESL